MHRPCLVLNLCITYISYMPSVICNFQTSPTFQKLENFTGSVLFHKILGFAVSILFLFVILRGTHFSETHEFQMVGWVTS
jgi:phosphoglycerol transferase MdoB-like AlkP superfamily enzyme